MGDQFVLNKYVNEHGGVQALELAEQLGIKTGDKIIKINGKDFEYFDDVYKADMLLSQNSSYTILRGDQQMEIPIPANFIENFNKKKAQSSFVMPRFAPQVETISTNSIASKVGLKKGDVFVEIQGRPIQYHDELKAVMSDLKSDTLSFKIKRGADLLSFNEPLNGSKAIGFYPMWVGEEGLKSINYSLGESVLIGPGRAFDVIWLQIKAFKKIFSGQLLF